MARTAGNTKTTSARLPGPKYHKPLILLLDLEDETQAALEAAGYNVSTGSFGKPYRVDKSDDFEPVITNATFPANFAEHEVVVVDLEPWNTLNRPMGEKRTPLGEEDWWAKCSHGKIDPRPRTMMESQQYFDRIYSHGGCFIIFTSPRIEQELALGYQRGYSFRKGHDIEADN